MAGSSPAMTTAHGVRLGNDDLKLLGNLVVEVTPVRIHRENEIDLPLARPVLDVLFPLDCSGGRVVSLIVNQHLNSIAFGETWYEAFPVLKGPTHQIVGDADVQRPAATIGEDIDPETHSAPSSPAGLTRGSIHFARLKGIFVSGWIAGSSPAMTERMGRSPLPRHPRA